MNGLREQIDLGRLPRHIAIIMDGNGRWAKQKGRPRVFGHRSAVQAVRDTTEAAAELGIEYLTRSDGTTCGNHSWRSCYTQ